MLNYGYQNIKNVYKIYIYTVCVFYRNNCVSKRIKQHGIAGALITTIILK